MSFLNMIVDLILIAMVTMLLKPDMPRIIKITLIIAICCFITGFNLSLVSVISGFWS